LGFINDVCIARSRYTNALNVNYVGFNRLRNIQFYYGKIGLLVGAPPSQEDCCAWQGAVVPDGQASLIDP